MPDGWEFFKHINGIAWLARKTSVPHKWLVIGLCPIKAPLHQAFNATREAMSLRSNHFSGYQPLDDIGRTKAERERTTTDRYLDSWTPFDVKREVDQRSGRIATVFNLCMTQR